MAPQRRAHDLPLAHRLISAGAHGLRRIPGQSVNLAHLIWRAPRAPAPLQGAPPVAFRAGLQVLGGVSTKAVSSRTASADPGPPNAKSTEVPALRFASAGMTGLVKRSVSLKAPLPLFMPSHKPKPARPRQGQLPRVDSPTLHSDLPH